jgi:hypothetical protein
MALAPSRDFVGVPSRLIENIRSDQRSRNFAVDVGNRLKDGFAAEECRVAIA